MNISEILSRKGSAVVTVAPTATVAEVVAVLAEHRIGAVPVLSGGRLAGIVSERDIVRQLAARGAGIMTLPVAELMTVELVTAAPTDSLDGIAGLMTERRIRHLPVLSGEQLTGIVTIGDVVAARLRELETTRAQLENYISQGS
ncbi:MAG TPA: CBS domain-containing protein [Jatrophihabitans sp.]|nr:CBS domain-containing protein [Jatrophihabitans sp.]